MCEHHFVVHTNIQEIYKAWGKGPSHVFSKSRGPLQEISQG